MGCGSSEITTAEACRFGTYKLQPSYIAKLYLWVRVPIRLRP